jgi:hypothetical protein
MNSLKKLYRDFFGITEVKYTVKKGDASGLETAKKAAEGDPNAEIKFESELSEAELLNHMEDYRGGIEYVIADPSQAQSTANDIRDWAERKGFKVIKQSISASGKVGYFYFRLGENPYKESKKIQGYISQLPIVKHFRFNVRQSNPKPQQDSKF